MAFLIHPPKTRERSMLYAAALLALALSQPRAFAQGPSEYEVKAAFLYNFARFVEWPAKVFHAPNGPLVFCVLGDDTFGGELEQMIIGKTIAAHDLIVHYLRGTPAVETCQVLYVAGAETSRAAQALRALKSAPVLTVADSEEALRAGAIVNFYLEENKIRFEINIDGAERAGLKVSSRLLKLARVVRDKN